MFKINFENLLTGFVNSYNGFLLSIDEEGRPDRAHTTYAIIDHFRALGRSLGFVPWQEVDQADLLWYTWEEDEKAFHLESENSPERVSHTINKLVNSKAQYVIGIIWTTDKFSNFESRSFLKDLSTATRDKNKEILLILRSEAEWDENVEGFKVRSYLAHNGEYQYLENYNWFIKWPENGHQTAIWEWQAKKQDIL